MGNLANPVTPIPAFGASDVPFVPPELRQGDSWNWTCSFPDYSSSLYTLTYVFNSPNNRFVLLGTGDAPPITADNDGQTFDIQAPAALTNGCQPDTYQFVAVLAGIADSSAAGQQVTIPLQNVKVEPNLATAVAPVDTRSFVKKTLDMIEAAILGNSRPDVAEYMINGRQLRKYDPRELTMLRATYKNLYAAERRANGEYAPRRVIGFRFNPGS